MAAQRARLGRTGPPASDLRLVDVGNADLEQDRGLANRETAVDRRQHPRAEIGRIMLPSSPCHRSPHNIWSMACGKHTSPRTGISYRSHSIRERSISGWPSTSRWPEGPSWGKASPTKCPFKPQARPATGHHGDGFISDAAIRLVIRGVQAANTLRVDPDEAFFPQPAQHFKFEFWWTMIFDVGKVSNGAVGI